MTYVLAPPITLMQFWRLHRAECRAVGSIVADAHAGRLPGIAYTDAALSIPMTFPVIANSAGKFPAIFFPEQVTYPPRHP